MGGPYELLAETLSQWGEQVGVDAVLWCLEELASHGLVRHSGEALHHADEADTKEPVAATDDAQEWEITEEGRAVVGPHSVVASAPTIAASATRRTMAETSPGW